MKARLLMLCALCAAPAFAVLMTPSEAEQAGDVACKPLASGLLDCVPIAAPTPLPGNDPAIQSLPAPEFEGEQFPPRVAEAPILPAVDPIPPQLRQNRLTVGWDIGFGTTAQWWEIWDNGNRVVRTRQFTQRRIERGGAEGAERLGETQLVSVQSGVHTLTDLATGRHELEIRLCNEGRDGSPACTPFRAVTWVGEGGEDESAQSSPPSVPELSWLPQVTTGEAVELAWNVWWGTPGQYWQLYDGERRLLESTTFTESTPHSQSGQITLTSLAPGVHDFSVRLCNRLECTASQSARLEVLLPEPRSPQPAVTVRKSTPDTVLLQWSLPQGALKAMPQRWRLLDPSGETMGEERNDVRTCQLADSKLAGVSVASYCGELRLALADHPEPVRVEVCLDDDCSKSDAIELLAAVTPVIVESRAPQAAAPVAADEAETPVVESSASGRFVVPDAVLDQLLDEAALTSGTRNRR